MGIYNLYLSKKNDNPKFVCVKEGFSFFASIFGSLWYFFNGIWSFACIILFAGAICQVFQFITQDIYGSIGYLIVAVFSGLAASDAKQYILIKSGYELVSSVYASCYSEARMKFCDKIYELNL